MDSTVFIGDHNTVNQTLIQKIFNIFKSDSETLEHRNRRILLNHVENAWIKGVLDASLHGAALLDLGIKQDPEAVTKYPWAIKRESTDETLPAGTSMLEIFDSIGMGRSLLILGAPGSGKTTMLLELTRGLIARAREDVTQPIPMVFNLASWTEKLSLADWLAQELNNLYSVPRKTAPDWVKGNKLLLLLDGLDEVRQESRAKCVEAINAFRKEHGLTSLVVCSRSHDFADLKAKLSFEGAIEVQPLTQEQIVEFFSRFGDEMAGIKQALEKDGALREMAETPLFLSIMLVVYRDKRDVEILLSEDEKSKRKYLLDTYVEHMFESTRQDNNKFKQQNIVKWLKWIGMKMVNNNLDPFVYENIQPAMMSTSQKKLHSVFVTFSIALYFGISGLIGTLLLLWSVGSLNKDTFGALLTGTRCMWVAGLLFGLIFRNVNIVLIDAVVIDWKRIVSKKVYSLPFTWLFISIAFYFETKNIFTSIYQSAFMTILVTIMTSAFESIETKKVNQSVYVGGRIRSSIRSWLTSMFLFGGIAISTMFLVNIWTGIYFVKTNLLIGFVTGSVFGLIYGGLGVLMHYSLRLTLFFSRTMPLQLVPFLDHCVDLIFLRRVGGGYIFVHRLLMEHFAEMYLEENA